jgi:hypothetical protein
MNYPNPRSGGLVYRGTQTPDPRRGVVWSNAPMGSLTTFQDGGGTFGAFVTVHPGTTRAVEIWRPA